MKRWHVAALLLACVAAAVPLGAGAAPTQQQSARDYLVAARAWQLQVEAAVAAVDERLTDTLLRRPSPGPAFDWSSTTARLALAASVDGLIDGAPRPAPGNEAYYRLLVEPVIEALSALSAGISVGRFEATRTALDELYNYLPRGVPADAAAAPPVVDAAAGDALLQAHLLGWRWYREPTPEAYLRDFWAAELQRLGQPVPPGADWAALRGLVNATLAARGPANVSAAGVGPRRQARSLSDPEFAPFVANLRALRFECDVFNATVNLEDTIDRFLRLMRRAQVSPGEYNNQLWVAQVNSIGRDWRDRYERLAGWTPPAPRYAAQQAEFLDLLGTLNLANENLGMAQRAAQVAQGSSALRGTDQLNVFYYREAASLVRDIRERIEALPEPVLRRDCIVVVNE